MKGIGLIVGCAARHSHVQPRLVLSWREAADIFMAIDNGCHADPQVADHELASEGLVLRCCFRFLQHSLPVKALYEERGLCAVITATAGVDEVFEQTKQALTRLLPSKLPKPTESGGQVCALHSHRTSRRFSVFFKVWQIMYRQFLRNRTRATSFADSCA